MDDSLEHLGVPGPGSMQVAISSINAQLSSPGLLR